MLTIYVYSDKFNYDCTNGGVSSKFNTLELFDEEEFRTKEVPENAVILVHRSLFSDGKDYPILVPCSLYDDYKNNKLPISFGGNFAFTSDSRFPWDYPLPIHDRVETWEEYVVFTIN